MSSVVPRSWAVAVLALVRNVMVVGRVDADGRRRLVRRLRQGPEDKLGRSVAVHSTFSVAPRGRPDCGFLILSDKF